MDHPLFTGACTALVTPFLNGQVNYPMLGILLQRQIDAGIPAVVLAGTTGESPTLTDTETLEMIRFGKAFTNNKMLIIAGTGCSNTSHAIEKSIAAENAGADALLIVGPYYNKATPDGLVAHYSAIADTVKIPIILYNVPSAHRASPPCVMYILYCVLYEKNCLTLARSVLDSRQLRLYILIVRLVSSSLTFSRVPPSLA